MGRPVQLRGQGETLERILAHADALICTSGAKRIIAPERIRAGQIVLALCNPGPKIDPAAALAAGAAIAFRGVQASTGGNMIGERLARSWQRSPKVPLHYDVSGRLGRSHKSFLSAEPAYAAGVCFRNCAANLPDLSDIGPQRAHLDTARVFGSPYADPVLLVDPSVALGRGLRHQLTRHGFCADLAITLEAARACVEHKYYYAMVVITDPWNSQSLFELRQLRECAPRTWIIVLAIKTTDPANDPVLNFGADAWLPIPFRFSDLLFHLESFAHRERAA